ncbi:MAG: hypothetical protein IPH44_28290 [Myxococcales bacterium]|nr:hypothetical protein [Myxococcales bacterium]MBK7191493.1 hypothetical protein [Myxococcales bacterium]MBP6848058.1 hypothetical protein [Kofleriaceae bacterium]
MTTPDPSLRPAAAAAGPEPAAQWVAKNATGLAALVVGAVGFVVTFMVQDPLWSMPDHRLTVPFFGLALVLAVVSVARRERTLVLPVAGVALAALAMVLGWFLVMAMIVAVAAIVILIMSMVM